MRRQIARNVVWLLGERALQITVSIAIVALIARGVGPEGFAHFQYAQSLVLIAASIGLICGAEVVVPRLVAHPSPDAQSHLIAHAFGLRALASIAGYLALLVSSVLTGQDATTVHIAAILGISILLREPFGVVTAWMQAHTDNRPSVVFSLSALAFKAVLIAALYFSAVHAVHEYAWTFALESGLLATMLAWYYARRRPRIRISPDRGLLIRLVRDGSVFWISMILLFSARRIDQLLLKPRVPLVDLGAYAACMQVLDNFSLLATIIASAVAPLAVYAQPSLAKARYNVLRVAGGMAAIGMAGGILIAIGAPWIVQLLYGERFEATVNLLQQGAIASGLIFADAGLALLAVHLRKPAWLVGKSLLVLVATAAVDLFTIPKYGVQGAVYGYIAANALAVVVSLGFVVLARESDAAKQAA
ncbi:Membrane protein involved in the export of O-antigen [Cupriavidus necator]|uniref:Lipopolysaccharide biosynthesis protein n=1 Tax=Cupriavidus necator (strain ATCC 17699 / DSM 428 / KCTC 22496 / NCIMB 10442 / H16 / Stanier 337) TaxID=381666 RepID=Q0K7Q7_CUPNH|nr:oligosaccharide flippase family protein [Cupriavidus necator]QCC01734.1 lipopolysaccharide biosynthesis protein [Cupriavidus necator H16]QQB75435.1 oligosaccharide flippase family protein [Cupriavidus necator]WKA40132.1 oligosaccharide flippase family protein [Cupriavidus necator]CAJ93964.1 Membrane protein involved in the export of O-antigen [Cupriavidus necator H16]